MPQRLVVRTFTVLELLDEDKFQNVAREKVRTSEITNHLADFLIDRTSTFRIESTTVVVKEDKNGTDDKS